MSENTNTDTPIYAAVAAKLGIDPLGVLDAPVKRPSLWERVLSWLQ